MAERSVLEERLSQCLTDLREIKEQLHFVGERINEAEKWRAATETLLDSQIERIDSAMDKVTEHQTYIDREKGGAAAKLQFWANLITAAGMTLTILKLFVLR